MNDLPEPPDWVLSLAGQAAGQGIPGFNQARSLYRLIKETASFGDAIEQATPRGSSVSLSADLGGGVRADKKALKDAEDAVKQSYDARQSITENYYRIQEARVAVSGKNEADQIKAVVAIRRQSINQQLAELSDYFQKAVKVSKDKESLDKLSAQYTQQRGKLETELALSAIEAEQKLGEVRKKQAEERKREAEKAQRDAEQLRKSIIGLFDSVGSGTSNPYVKYLSEAEKFSRSLLEVTKGLTAEQRSFLQATNDANIALQRSEQRASSIHTAFSLQTEARSFRRGYNLTGQAAVNERNNDLFDLLSRFRRGNLAKEVYDREVIEVTRGIDPRTLPPGLRYEAAQSREREAGRILQQERNANDFYSAMKKIIGQNGLKVSVADGTAFVRVVNQSDRAEVSQAPKKADVDSVYGRPVTSTDIYL
jgi:hypothetical protein